MKNGVYGVFFKRVIDFLLSGMALLIFSPLILLIVFLIRKNLGSPVLFKQNRIGKDEKIFKLYKFRTMTEARDKSGELLDDRERKTPFGDKLRSTSLDELPQLINILKGDMAIVGPRPLLDHYIPYYTERERLRHAVRPGLTGLAQISGRNFIGWDKKLEKDVEYVENMSFTLDMKITFKTAKKVVMREDIALEGQDLEGDLSEVRRDEGNTEK